MMKKEEEKTGEETSQSKEKETGTEKRGGWRRVQNKLERKISSAKIKQKMVQEEKERRLGRENELKGKMERDYQRVGVG